MLVRPAGFAAKHSIAYLAITGDDDRYTGLKKYKSHKSTKPRFYDGELQIMKRKLKLFMMINWTLFLDEGQSKQVF